MKLRILVGATAVAAALATTALATTMPAGAADSDVRQGWWSAANLTGSTPPSITGSDVPADGLLVQGGPSDAAPVAISAIVVRVPADSVPSSLVVHLAPDGRKVSGSTLKACPLKSTDFEPAQGGAMTKAPAYDCTGVVPLAVGADGQTFTFEATPLLVGDTVAAALVAGTPATRVVLAKPGDDVLTSLAPSSSGADLDAGSLPSTDAYDMGAPLPSTNFAPLPELAVPALPAVPPPAVNATGSPTAKATELVPTSPALPIGPAANRIAVAIALLALAAAAVTWRLSGRRPPRLAVASATVES